MMDKVKIYTDEDLAIAISRALRLRGFKAYTIYRTGKI